MKSATSSEASASLDQLTAAQAVASGSALRRLQAGAERRQDVAQRVVAYFYENFRLADTGESSCVLARCFQTTSYASLPLDYQEAADRLLHTVRSDDRMRCLALLATRGDRITWNEVETSIGHQAIPLPSVEVVRRAPMIARLMEQLEVPLDRVVSPTSAADFLLEASPHDFKIFHVQDAVASPFIPAQEQFVEPFGVKSVVGMGGILPDGELFVVILFLRVAITREVAQLFRGLAVDIKEALSPFGVRKIFA